MKRDGSSRKSDVDSINIASSSVHKLIRSLAEERSLIEGAIADAHRAADEIRRASRSANDAAGSISYEASRLRR